MSLIALEDARARGVPLPADDDVAQDIIDEQEAWLAARIGLLVGERAETFYVGLAQSHGKLGLARFTDEVDVTDGGAAVGVDLIRLIDRGSAIVQAYAAPSRWWTGPYVVATYEPNDELLVRSALYDILALSAAPPSAFQSEQIGAYSYQRGASGQASSATAQKAAIAAALLPKHDSLVTLRAGRLLRAGDPVINRPEPVW